MVSLLDKIYGCIAASNIGSAMGAPVEGWDAEKIQEEFGILCKLLPYSHYGGRERLPGTTEDGIERQRLMCIAINDKKGRITADDLATVWAREIDPNNFGVQLEPWDEIIYRLSAIGHPPINVRMYSSATGGDTIQAAPNFFSATNIGRHQIAPGSVIFARHCQPIGVINAGDPLSAAEDALQVGKMFLSENDIALYWGAAVAVAIAEGLKPKSTVQSIIETVKRYIIKQVADEIEHAIEIAENCKDVFCMREPFNKIFCNKSGLYPLSSAHEVVSKAFAIFWKTKGSPKDCIIAAVNFGRDTDCLAATAGGMSGALNGCKSLPDEWIRMVDYATKKNEYTVLRKNLSEISQDLYDSLYAKCMKYREQLELFKMVENENKP